MADAKQIRLLAGSFGAATTTPANPYPIANGNANTVAADRATHDVYVGDIANRRVEKFDSEGHFLFMFGAEVNKTEVESGTATAAQENLCPIDPGDVCQPGTATTAPGGFLGAGGVEVQLLSVAVDNSPGPSRGNVYVGDNGGHLVSKFDEEGHLISSWGNNGPLETPNGQLNGSNATGPRFGPFSQIEGIAVDVSGDLWVNSRPNAVTANTMFEFGQDGKFITDWPADPPIGIGPALDSAGNIYNGLHVVKYDPAGLELGYVFVSPNRPGVTRATSLAVDPSVDELYVGVQLPTEPATSAVQRFDSSCHPTRAVEGAEHPCTPVESIDLGGSQPRALALDPSGHALYVSVGQVSGQPSQILVYAFKTVPDTTTTKASGFTSSTATLGGAVNPVGLPVTECFFEWGETESYGNTAECEPAAASLGSGTSPVPVHAQISGLQSGHTYHFRLVAANANDKNGLVDQPERGADLAFGPPKVESSSTLEVSSADAFLEGVVNPNNIATTAWLEYGTKAGGYAHSTSKVDLADGGLGVAFSPRVHSLAPGTTYHYRVVAESALGVSQGPDTSFTTQPVEPFGLPDGRGYELVSPPDKRGGIIEGLGTGVTEASASGNAITYLANAPIERNPPGYGGSSQAVSIRGSDGWATSVIASPHQRAAGSGPGSTPEYRLFAEDFSAALLQPFGPFNPDLSDRASEQTPYLRALGSCAKDCYGPLVTGKPGFANVPEETHFGREFECDQEQLVGITASSICGPRLLGGTPTLSHAILWSTEPLVEGAPEGGERSRGSLYEWTRSSGSLQLISILPPNGSGEELPAPVGTALFGRNFVISGGEAPRAISTDGSRVIWSSESRLFLRDTELGNEQTVQLDLKDPSCVSCESGAGSYQIASENGSRVFFTDSRHLTANSGGTPRESDLYECSITEDESGRLKCTLTDLTPKVQTESAGVRKNILGASSDGSSVYFAASAVLASNEGADGSFAGPATCEEVPGSVCNLYLVHDGAITFIATASGGDRADWEGAQAWQPTRVSPDGNWFTFMSQRSLTGYDNRDLQSKQLDAEIYLYDAASNRLSCASCDPTGARPTGIPYGPLESGNDSLHTLRGEWGSTEWVAALLPQSTSAWGEDGSAYQARYLSDSGRLYFNALGGLVPSDSNGTGDVYEFEQPQAPGQTDSDSCSPDSPAFSQHSGGCLSLISSGTSKESASFLDASGSGDDVFFRTSQSLTPKDVDTANDVYDARVGGGEPEAVKPVECSGDACQQPAAPPNDATPGSLTFQGTGNVVECPNGKVKKNGKCGKKNSSKHKHHKKRGKKNKRTASHKGGGGK
jgi:hypothetical protein